MFHKYVVLVSLFFVVPAFSQTQSFDEKAGVLAIDRAAYFSKNDIVWKGPITDPSKGITV